MEIRLSTPSLPSSPSTPPTREFLCSLSASSIPLYTKVVGSPKRTYLTGRVFQKILSGALFSQSAPLDTTEIRGSFIRKDDVLQHLPVADELCISYHHQHTIATLKLPQQRCKAPGIQKQKPLTALTFTNLGAWSTVSLPVFNCLCVPCISFYPSLSCKRKIRNYWRSQ